jgi:hypothetical protein
VSELLLEERSCGAVIMLVNGAGIEACQAGRQRLQVVVVQRGMVGGVGRLVMVLLLLLLLVLLLLVEGVESLGLETAQRRLQM